jgi:hypothetical protein
MPVVTSDVGVPSALSSGLFDPRDQAPAAGLRPPVADLRARRAGLPDVGQELGERVPLLVRDHEVARVTAEHLLARVPGGALARVVEEHDPAAAVVDADERLGRLGQDRGERLAETELRVFHVSARRQGTVAPS